MPPRLRRELLLISVSLFSAFVLWLIAKQGEMDTDWLDIAVEIENVPEYLTVRAQPGDVALNVQYPVSLSSRVIPRNFAIRIDPTTVFELDPTRWSNPREARKVTYRLDPGRVQRRGLPRTIHVTGFEPPEVELEARLRTLELRVRVEYDPAELPDNLVLTGPPQPDPPTILVTGPRELLNRLTTVDGAITTASIRLAGMEGSKQLYPKVNLPEGAILLDPATPRIAVDVGIDEREVERRLDEVPIEILVFTEGLYPSVTPPTAEIVLEGPASALSEIGRDDIEFATTRALDERPGRPQEVGIQARLNESVAPGVAARVHILECIPPTVRVEFVREAPRTLAPDAVTTAPAADVETPSEP